MRPQGNIILHMVTIIEKNNSLYVTPPIEGIEYALSFRHSYREKKKTAFYSRNAGRMIERIVDGPIKSERVAMYVADEEKNLLITYAGLKQRLIEFLDGKMEEYTITKEGTPLATPDTDSWVYEGLHLDQRCAAEAMISHDGGCLLEAATSAGKTYVIAALCRAYTDYKGLIVTNRQSVASRLYDSLVDLCPDSEIGIYTSSKKVKGRTMIITAASLKNYNPSEIGFIVYDECHGASGEARSADLLRFNKSVRYGMSATIHNEFTGMHNYLEGIFGPVVYRTTDEEVEDYGRASPLNVYVIDVNEGPEPDAKTQDLTMERHGIWYNRARNKLIKQCCDMAPEDQQLVVFVRTKYHLDYLKDYFLKDFEVYHGQLTQKEKKKILEGFNDGTIKRIISTDSLAEGVDPKALFITINANWMQSNVSVVQKAGRNRRLADGKSFGVVIDFNDNWNTRFERKAKNKLSKYYNRGYTIIENAKPNTIKFCET
jgi:superfamily II DNA or RNA helicase